MKNLIYISALLIIAHCLEGCKSKSSGRPASGDTVPCPTTPAVMKTLNGFLFKDAQSMIIDYCNNFKNGVSDYPVKTVHTWFSIDQIQNMYNLLKCESKANGVRFYLGSEDASGNLNNVNYHILLTTTFKDIGGGTGQTSCGAVTKQSVNRDYYEHNADYLTGSGLPFGDALPGTALQAISEAPICTTPILTQ